ncbi:hypothetical protein [Listeria seeligeri]|uniref:hypothetical protein n=1 Tax=Listeria seeligeri TaxID=1640 RepID=UPI0022EA9472|nr:hypothetical protein [Listeria seeligeri]
MIEFEKFSKIIKDIRFLKQDEINEVQELIDIQKAYTNLFKRGEMREIHKIAEHNQRMLDGLLVLKEVIADFVEE